VEYRDKIRILDLIVERANELKKEIMREQLKRGYCPHENTVDKTTFVDKDNKIRRIYCKDCNSIFKEKISDPDEME